MTSFGRLVLGLLVFSGLALAADANADTKPRVRAITGFVRLEPARYVQQINAALSMLRAAKAEFIERGYEVQTLRIVTQPLGDLVGARSTDEALKFLKSLDDLSVEENFDYNVGPAMLADSDDPRTMQLLANALVALPNVSGSAIIAGPDGVHWKVIRETAALLRYVTDRSASSESHGNFNFTATAMLKPYAPFFPGAYHVGAGRTFSIGFEGANVVQEVFARTHGDFNASVAELTRQLAVHAKIAESVGRHIARESGWTFAGVDPTPAPAPQPNLSIATAMESFTGHPFGSSGTLTAALAITTAVKSVPVQQVGYSGLMLPVMEDLTLAERWAQGRVDADELLAYSSVCGTGLDTIPYPGSIATEQLARVLGDVASLAYKWSKPLSARLIPFKGLKAGDRTHFRGQFLSNTTLRSPP